MARLSRSNPVRAIESWIAPEGTPIHCGVNPAWSHMLRLRLATTTLTVPPQANHSASSIISVNNAFTASSACFSAALSVAGGLRYATYTAASPGTVYTDTI